jgi:hypothetical protein
VSESVESQTFAGSTFDMSRKTASHASGHRGRWQRPWRELPRRRRCGVDHRRRRLRQSGELGLAGVELALLIDDLAVRSEVEEGERGERDGHGDGAPIATSVERRTS